MPSRVRTAGAFLAVLLFPGIALGQMATASSASPQQSATATAETSVASASAASSGAAKQSTSSDSAANADKKSKQKKKKEQLPSAPTPGSSTSELQQTNRMLWVVPNFAAVSPGVKFEPMTPKQKFWMATEDSFDYSSFVWTGVLAAQSYALDQYPEFGTGRLAYGRYYWRGMLDGVSNSYFSEAIMPALTHEDPRYFTLGRGGFFRRLGYALTRVVVTYDDSGHNTFNISEVGGDFASSALSTAYYPPEERGMVKISEGWGTELESAALNNIAKEFWPDIHKHLLHLFKH